MIKRFYISCNLLAAFFTAPLQADRLSYAEWQQLQQLSFEQDFVEFSDGLKVLGHVESLPPLDFSIGRLHFAPEELTAISLHEQQGKLYMQAITRNGYSYFAPVGNGTFRISNKEVPPKNVRFIAFKRGEKVESGAALYTLILRNGQQLPAAIDSEETFTIPKVAEPIQIARTQIAKLQPDQNGFELDPARNHLVGSTLYIAAPEVLERRQRRLIGQACDIGNSAGTALEEAFGCLPVQGEEIVALRSFGNECLVEDSEDDWLEIVTAALELDTDDNWLEIVAAALEPETDDNWLEIVAAALEPLPLFDPTESWPAEEIAFDDLPDGWLDVVAAALEPEPLFDPNESWPEEKIAFEEPLTPEALDRIADVLAEEDLEEIISRVRPPSKRVQAFWDDLLTEEEEDFPPLNLKEPKKELVQEEPIVQKEPDSGNRELVLEQPKLEIVQQKAITEQDQLDLLLSDTGDKESETALINFLVN